MAHAPVLIGATVLGWAISLGLGLLPRLGWLLGPLIGWVLQAGLSYMFIRRIRGEEVQVGDLFAGFNIALANIVLAGLFVWALTAVGLFLCVLPGIYLAVSYVFVLPLVIDKKMEFWTAMEVSRRVVHEQWFSVFLLGLALFVICCAGALLCGVAILAAPWRRLTLFVYEDMFGRIRSAEIITLSAVVRGGHSARDRTRSGQTASRSHWAPSAWPRPATTRAPTPVTTAISMKKIGARQAIVESSRGMGLVVGERAGVRQEAERGISENTFCQPAVSVAYQPRQRASVATVADLPSDEWCCSRTAQSPPAGLSNSGHSGLIRRAGRSPGRRSSGRQPDRRRERLRIPRHASSGSHTCPASSWNMKQPTRVPSTVVRMKRASNESQSGTWRVRCEDVASTLAMPADCAPPVRTAASLHPSASRRLHLLRV